MQRTMPDGWRAMRVENIVHPGTADTYWSGSGRSGWIELKDIELPPVILEGSRLAKKEQGAFLRAHGRNGVGAIQVMRCKQGVLVRNWNELPKIGDTRDVLIAGGLLLPSPAAVWQTAYMLAAPCYSRQPSP